MTDREKEIREILSGPDYMDCPAGLGARIPIADCVARQTRGICLQGNQSGWIPEMCRDCSVGREALKAYKKGGEETMGKKANNPKPPVGAVRPDPPPAPPAPADFVGWEASSNWPEVVSPPPPMPLVKPARSERPSKWAGPVVLVDFTGHEDLLERFEVEAAKEKESPSRHLLWLAGVYIRELDR